MSTPFQSDPHYHAAVLAADLRAIYQRLGSVAFAHGDAVHSLAPLASQHLADYSAFVQGLKPEATTVP